jgi:hypothetical protein
MTSLAAPLKLATDVCGPPGAEEPVADPGAAFSCAPVGATPSLVPITRNTSPVEAVKEGKAFVTVASKATALLGRLTLAS